MGIIINLYLIKDNSNTKELDFNLILNKLGVQSEIDQKGITYEGALSEFWTRNPEPLIRLSYYNGNYIIQDDYNLINRQAFEAFTKELETSLLQADNSDTVGICSFSYFEHGTCIRRKSFGLDSWAEEMREAGIEIPKEAFAGDWDEGKPLDFESNGSSALEVMEAYGVPWDKLHDLEWELRLIIE